MKPSIFFAALVCTVIALLPGIGSTCARAAIIFPKEGEDYKAIAYRDFVSFCHAMPIFGIKNLDTNTLSVTMGHRWYWMDYRSVTSGKLLATATTDHGLAYVVLSGTNVIGITGIGPDKTNHWSQGGILSMGRADHPIQEDPLMAAFEKAKELPQIKNKDYEFRFLTMQGMIFQAIWLHADSDDILFPISDGYKHWEACHPYSENEMARLLKVLLDEESPPSR